MSIIAKPCVTPVMADFKVTADVGCKIDKTGVFVSKLPSKWPVNQLIRFSLNLAMTLTLISRSNNKLPLELVELLNTGIE